MRKSDTNELLSPDQPCLGILMLETQFPRILGDIGHPDSWAFPVRYHVVASASAERALRKDARTLTPLFIDAARELVAQGVSGLTTSCGFLSLVQQELTAAVNVPVATSSLMQVPMVQATLPPGRRVGVLTIDAAHLSQAHLQAARVPPNTPVVGTDPDGAFASCILNDEPDWDEALCRTENLAAAQDLMQKHSDVGAVVLECTNMVPYAADIHELTGVPVYTIHSFISWFYSGLMPHRF